MNKNNSLLNSIKAKIGAETTPSVAADPVQVVKEKRAVLPESDKVKVAGKGEVLDTDSILESGGFIQLFRVLEAAREDLDFGRNAVYIDEETAEVLDLLRKKFKIKSNLLVSYLLHEFFRKHKGLMQDLVEKRSNKLLE